MAKINDGLFGSFTAVKKIGMSLERLRYWERLGIITPVYARCGMRKFRRYSQADLKIAILVKKLVDKEKYSLEGAIRKLKTRKKITRGF